MKILFLTTHFNTGGITSYILTLGEGLARSGHQVWVASSGGDAVSRLEAAGITHVTVNIRTKSEASYKLWASFGPLERLVRRERIDIIHAQTRVTQVLGVWLSRATKVKMVTTCHGFFRPRWFRKAFPCWGRAVIAISKPVAQHLKQDFNVAQDKVYLIPHGIDLARFVTADDQKRRAARQKWGIADTPLIGIIARLSDVKGIDILIKAMPLVIKEIPSANLLIAGQGPQENALKELTDGMSLTGQIHFINAINQTQELLCALDVFVMPSLMEGLGLSVIEAQACGIPVVSSRVGGLVDLIQDGQSGYLVPANDPKALADRIVGILKAPEHSRAMAQNARINVEKNFSAELMLKETLGIYEQYSRC
jgi:glycosyltransferase involved in cell wall biosynthesis